VTGRPTRIVRSFGGTHGLAAVGLILAVAIGLAVVLHWAVISIGALTALGVVARQVLTSLADARDARDGAGVDDHLGV